MDGQNLPPLSDIGLIYPINNGVKQRPTVQFDSSETPEVGGQGGQIMPTILLRAPPSLRTMRHLCS